jgi:PAS domain S-box-containing protein
VIVDRDRKIVAVNRTFSPGLPPAQVLGSDAVDMPPPEDQDRARQLVDRCFETGEPQDLDHRLRGGHLVHARISPLRQQGTVDRLLIISTDITERKQLEERLRDAQRMATMASIVGAVAHEVRNPLFALSATLDAFEASHPQEGSGARFLARLREQFARIGLLMQELLDYGRPYTPNLVRGALLPVIEQALATNRHLADRKGVRLQITAPETLPPIAQDAPRLRQVFENLVKNAIEHSPEALYPTGTDERRWVEGVLAKKKGLGL